MNCVGPVVSLYRCTVRVPFINDAAQPSIYSSVFTFLDILSLYIQKRLRVKSQPLCLTYNLPLFNWLGLEISQL
jgi:hypothetical protein